MHIKPFRIIQETTGCNYEIHHENGSSDHRQKQDLTLLRSEGDAFDAGANLGEGHGMTNKEYVEDQKNAQETNNCIADHPVVNIAVVDGIAYGADSN